ncbi:carbohydrate-binding protein [Pseudanabaenaceae cyanobacterium LEGE 13415]|nr:carbohydrate-binding protein [Pseudanabaenaceae cyanobacterium LEGE 13415]
MLTTVNATSVKSRLELRSLFRNKSQLSEAHFAELINSVLNKRDDRFYGMWQRGQTYRKGDIVYYDRALWELQADEETCGRDEEAPGTSNKWTSRLKDLEDKVELLNQTVKAIQQELQTFQKEFTTFKTQVTKLLSLLTLGVGFVFLWLLFSAIAHLI